MKGHPGIVVEAADDTTHLSISSAPRTVAPTGNAKDEGGYDGFAHVASVTIFSRNGEFGGGRTANNKYFADHGFAGIRAPGVKFRGPVFVGEITASDEAVPILLIGSATDVRITGGNLRQLNAHLVQIGGISRAEIGGGWNSGGGVAGAARH